MVRRVTRGELLCHTIYKTSRSFHRFAKQAAFLNEAVLALRYTIKKSNKTILHAKLSSNGSRKRNGNRRLPGGKMKKLR